MLPVFAKWLLVAAFAGAGVFNAIGTPANQDSFARWGYPRWWGRVTGALELVIAVMIAFTDSRATGLVFGAIIVGAALVTILRHRDFSHLPPLGLFAGLLALVAVTA
jgi:hypothetical protein